MPTELSESIISTIIEKMNATSSVELQAIYDEKNYDLWSPEAFEAIRRILDERAQSGYEPTQKKNSNNGKTSYAKNTISVRAYPALRIVISFYWCIALFVGITAVAFIFVGFAQGNLGITILALLGGLIGVITCIAAAEAIKVFLDIEDNTRRSTDLLKQIVNERKEV